MWDSAKMSEKTTKKVKNDYLPICWAHGLDAKNGEKNTKKTHYPLVGRMGILWGNFSPKSPFQVGFQFYNLFETKAGIHACATHSLDTWARVRA
jgi:hypothetical protein